MTLYYSKTTNSFFDDSINTNIPSDAVIITDTTHQTLLADQAGGKVITYDDSGNPVSNVPSYTTAQLWAQEQVLAKLALADSDVTMLRIQEGITLGTTTATATDVVTFVTYRQALRAIISAQSGTPGSLPTKPAYPAGT